VYYNILIDPWLSGPQSDVASWFSQQWHAIEPAVKGIDGVTRLIWDIEDVAARDIEANCVNEEQANGKRKRVSADTGCRTNKRHNNGTNGYIQQEKDESETGIGGTCIDAVAVSHEFTDHCHKDTLLELERHVPVFATTKAASLIRSWDHFHTVIETPVFSSSHSDWRQVSVPPLPEWLSISRLVEKQDALYYHSALMVAFNLDASPMDRVASSVDRNSDRNSSDAAECIIYTPHGIPYAALSPLSNTSPHIQTLAFLHGLHDVAISGWTSKALQQLNLGAHNGLQAQRILQAKYWCGTHDEIKAGRGLITWFLKRKIHTVEEALSEEGKRMKDRDEKGVVGLLQDTKFQDIGNGQSRVLE